MRGYSGVGSPEMERLQVQRVGMLEIDRPCLAAATGRLRTNRDVRGICLLFNWEKVLDFVQFGWSQVSYSTRRTRFCLVAVK